MLSASGPPALVSEAIREYLPSAASFGMPGHAVRARHPSGSKTPHFRVCSKLSDTSARPSCDHGQGAPASTPGCARVFLFRFDNLQRIDLKRPLFIHL